MTWLLFLLCIRIWFDYILTHCDLLCYIVIVYCWWLLLLFIVIDGSDTYCSDIDVLMMLLTCYSVLVIWYSDSIDTIAVCDIDDDCYGMLLLILLMLIVMMHSVVDGLMHCVVTLIHCYWCYWLVPIHIDLYILVLWH